MNNRNTEITMPLFVEEAFKARDMGKDKISREKFTELALSLGLGIRESATLAYLADKRVDEELFELDCDTVEFRGDI